MFVDFSSTFHKFIVRSRFSLWIGALALIIAAGAMHPIAALWTLPVDIALLLAMRLVAMIEGRYRLRIRESKQPRCPSL
jgi:membrane protein implicated in regulation of membrane protease activity